MPGMITVHLPKVMMLVHGFITMEMQAHGVEVLEQLLTIHLDMAIKVEHIMENAHQGQIIIAEPFQMKLIIAVPEILFAHVSDNNLIYDCLL